MLAVVVKSVARTSIALLDKAHDSTHTPIAFAQSAELP